MPPATNQRNLVYEYVCHCESKYVGRTTLRLWEGIQQHVPKTIKAPESSQNLEEFDKEYSKTISYISAIGLHLLKNPDCGEHHRDGNSSCHRSWPFPLTFIRVGVYVNKTLET